jgi:predicted glycogen debranching enzyme
MNPFIPADAEWLEADGLGGFASGTASGRRTRRYHALLLAAATPPTGRFVQVNGLDAHVETGAGSFAVSSQFYRPGVTHPDGERRLDAFTAEPWPRWVFELEDGTRIEHELFVPRGTCCVALRWRRLAGTGRADLKVRPLLSGRDYHALHRENPAFRFEPAINGAKVLWRPYQGVPGTLAYSNGRYEHRPEWYRDFLYSAETERGLDDSEDLASPGEFHFDLASGPAVLLLAAQDVPGAFTANGVPAEVCYELLRSREEARRAVFSSPLHRAADAYLVRRGRGRTILAGYPWFTDWGRDTFIALRGLCLATGRLDDARQILLDWAETVSDGMLPNRFPDLGDALEFNSVDASLWYVIAVHDYLRSMCRANRPVPRDVEASLRGAVQAILAGYSRGTRHGIHADDDGLLAAGETGVQLTWLDAKIGDWVVTPRIGKPVEVQALWLNALWIGSRFAPEWRSLFERGRAAFIERFWNDAAGCLHDVIDVDHQRGTADTSFRPNQVFAVGGLPLALLEGERARKFVDAVEARLVTPLGLRTLAPDEPGYRPQYAGGVRERDSAYHQGTAWPWLLGPFVEEWIRVRGGTAVAKREARHRFVEPLLRHLNEAGLGHVSEIADGDAPHRPNGCPFQAWSLGELLRLEFDVLAEPAAVERFDSTIGELDNRRVAV